MLLRRSCGIRRENRWEWQLSPELRQAILELVRGEARETLQDPSIATQLSPNLVETLLRRLYAADQSISSTTCAGGESSAEGERK